MPEVTAKFRAKGLDQTGITEAHAEKLWAGGAGKYGMAIIEFRTEEPHGPTSDGKRRIDCVITQVEPVPDVDAVDNAVRELSRAMASMRRVQNGELALDGMPDPAAALDAAVDGVKAVIQRDDDGKVTGVWTGDPDAPMSEQTWGQGSEPKAEAAAPAAKKATAKKTAAKKTAAAPPEPTPVDTAEPADVDQPGGDVVAGPWPGDPDWRETSDGPGGEDDEPLAD